MIDNIWSNYRRVIFSSKILITYILIVSISYSCGSGVDCSDEDVWWKETVFYEIYMPSYKDSNGDGVSDFNGLTEKLDYMHSLGIRGVWLTPFLKSPKIDNGYDVSDYNTIDEVYGSRDDFKAFINEAHKRDIKVIMDMVINHTSTEHLWFRESRKSKDNLFRNYYIWKDSPNNWESFFGGSAWEFDTLTGQYYYHKFAKEMADLNWQNPAVIKEVQNVLRYWLDLGVDGFRLDVINFLITDGVTVDNPVNEKGEQKHVYDIDQKGVKHAMRIIKETVNEFDNRFLVGEIGSDKLDILKEYQGCEQMDVVFNFNFGSISEFSAQNIFDEIQNMESQMSSFPTLFFGSHDMPRLYSRLTNDNPQRALALAALLLTAKGVPFIYYGEEIGMQNHRSNSFDEIKDIQGITHYKLAIEEGKSQEEALIIANNNNRDKSRSPMQWNSDTLAGFSTQRSWIEINPDYVRLNVEDQSQDSASMLSKYRQLISIRKSVPALQYGSYKQLEFKDDCIHYIREFNGQSVSVYINFGKPFSVDLPANSKVLLGSPELKTNTVVIYM